MVVKKDETSRRASWSGIAEQLEYWIESGRLQAGQRLPSEESLAKELGCHRDTLRTAIRCLAGEGKLTRRKGSGFTVAMPRFRRNLYDFEPLWYFLQQNRRQFTSRVISMERLKPVPRVARLLKLNEAGEAYRLRRLRFLDGTPAILETTYLSALRVRDLERFDLAKNSLFEIMATEYGIYADSGNQTLSITYADEMEAELLQIPVLQPLLLLRGVTRDDYGIPIESFSAVIRNDQFGFEGILRAGEPDSRELV